jgi:uncharacterized membrane protein
MSEQPINPDITQDDKLWAALGYPIVPVAIIMLFLEEKKVRPFIKYHAIHGIAINILVWIVITILGITVVGAICAPVIWLATLYPAYQAFTGVYWEIPYLTKFLKGQGWVS